MPKKSLGIAIVLALVAVGLTASPASATSSCWDYKIFAARGTDETPGNGTLGLGDIANQSTATLENSLDAAHKSSNATAVDYPATAFVVDPISYQTNRAPYDLSVLQGVNDLEIKMLQYQLDCGSSSKVVLVGYSQGADVVGRVMQDENLSSTTRGMVAGVMLFGDTQFNPADSEADSGSYDYDRSGFSRGRSDPSGAH